MMVLKEDHTGLVYNRLMYSLLVLHIPPINFIILTLSREKSNEIKAPNTEAVREIMRIRPNMELVSFVFNKNGGKGFQMVDTKSPNSLQTNQTTKQDKESKF